MRLYEVRIHFYIHFTIAGSHARCPTISGNELGLGFVLAFRVEKQNIGSSRNRNPVGTVYSN